MKVYVFSGLGADQRVFDDIDWKQHEPVFIPWIQPVKNETIESYALRMSTDISEENPVLLGISFGGMMAIEVSKHLKASKIILISSAKTFEEIPWYFKLVGKLRINKIVPAALLKSSNSITHWFFGTKTEKEKNTLRIILKETDPVYVKWAVDAVLNWKNKFVPDNLVHIHGTADRILPIRFLKCCAIVENGRHFMIVSQSEIVNALILKSLDQK